MSWSQLETNLQTGWTKQLEWVLGWLGRNQPMLLLFITANTNCTKTISNGRKPQPKHTFPPWIHIFCLLVNCSLLYNNSCTMHIHIQINIIELVTRRCNVNWPSDPTDLNISIVLMRRPQWQLKLTNVRAKGFGRVGTQSLWSLFGRKNQWLILSVALRSPLNWSDLSTMQYVPDRVTSEVK